MQIGDALGARPAEHLSQRQVVEVLRLRELSAVRARPGGVAGREQHGVGVERRSQQHRLRFGAAAFVVTHLRQRIEVRPGHAGGDGLGTQRDNGRVVLRIEVVEQGSAAEDGASAFTELIAG